MERYPCPDCGAPAWYASTGVAAIFLDEDRDGAWVLVGRYGRTPRGAAPLVVTMRGMSPPSLFEGLDLTPRYRRHACGVPFARADAGGSESTVAPCQLADEERSVPPAHPLPPLERNTAALGRAHPATSATAAAFVLPRSGTQRRRILEQLTARGPATDDDLEEALGLPHQSASARRNGLVADGWLEALCDDVGAPMTRRNRNGNAAILWTLTDAARTALR